MLVMMVAMRNDSHQTTCVYKANHNGGFIASFMALITIIH
jgi:hypothetical protein